MIVGIGLVPILVAWCDSNVLIIPAPFWIPTRGIPTVFVEFGFG
jgi:hypothetical protein